MATNSSSLIAPRRLAGAAIAMVLLLFTVLAGPLPASAGEPPGVTSTTTAAVQPNSTTLLQGVSMAGFDGAAPVQLIVSTDVGTLALPTHSNTVLDYGNNWSGDTSISFWTLARDVNVVLASLTLTVGDEAGPAHITVNGMLKADGYVYSPSNGHFYQYVASPGVTWPAARTAAKAASFLGQSGYLASMNNATLNDLVANRIQGAKDVYFGAESTDTPPDPVKRTWAWSDGPLAGQVFTRCTNNVNACQYPDGDPVHYNHWAWGEPNNSNMLGDPNNNWQPIPQSGEPVAVTNWQGGVGEWNDLPYNAGSRISGYVVEYGDQVNGSTGFTGLYSDTSIVVIARAPDAPRDVVATRGDHSAKVSFTPGSDNGTPITGYRVTASPGGAVTTCAASPCSITGLDLGTPYTFTVAALFAGGSTADSAVSNAVTPVAKPGPPTAVSADAGNSSATITFTAPADDGGATVTSYTVSAAPGTATKTCSASPCVISGLTNGQPYTFTVHATNDAGNSTESDASGQVTPLSAPGAPTGVTADPGNRSASVSFVAPAQDGGNPIVDYTVTSAPGGLTSTCHTSPCEVLGLTNGTAYTFTVVARNEIGSSDASNPSVAVTPATVPAAPTNLHVTRGDGKLDLTFSAPTDAGGSAIIRYEVSVNGANWATLPTTGTTSLTATVPGLTNGTPYVVRVRAVNLVGGGAAASADPVSPAHVPDQVTGVTGTRGSGQVTVAWSTPHTGGSPITGYTVTTHPGGVSQACPASPCVVTGLDNGTAYTFTVTATNVVGEGPSSDASAAVTPASAPSAPSLTSATSAAGALVLVLHPGESDGGSPLTGYQVSTDDGATWRALTTSGTTTVTGTVTGLVNGSTYHVRVRATNTVGASPQSDALTRTPATVPGRPRGVTVTGTGGQATVSWTAPSSNGGATITGYVTTASPGGQTCRSTTTSCVFAHLAVGVRYTFTVVAVNTTPGLTGTGVGVGGVSAPFQLATRPGLPRAVRVTPGDRTLTISFLAPLTDGGSTITGYEYSVEAGHTWVRLPAAARATTVAPVRNGSSFTVLVRAVNRLGRGPATAPVTVRTVAWFTDPVSAAAHKQEIAVPKNPKKYRGPQRYTRAHARSHNGTIAYPDTRLAGRQLQSGQAIDLGGALVFPFDSANLSTQGQARVRAMALSLRYVTKLTCEGYADYAGSAKHEQALALQRAAVVCAALRTNAHQVTSLEVTGYGGTQPVIVGGKAVNRASNRRVVVVIR